MFSLVILGAVIAGSALALFLAVGAAVYFSAEARHDRAEMRSWDAEKRLRDAEKRLRDIKDRYPRLRFRHYLPLSDEQLSRLANEPDIE